MTTIYVTARLDQSQPCACNAATPWSAAPCSCNGLLYESEFTTIIIPPIEGVHALLAEAHVLIDHLQAQLTEAQVMREPPEPSTKKVRWWKRLL